MLISNSSKVKERNSPGSCWLFITTIVHKVRQWGGVPGLKTETRVNGIKPGESVNSGRARLPPPWPQNNTKTSPTSVGGDW